MSPKFNDFEHSRDDIKNLFLFPHPQDRMSDEGRLTNRNQLIDYHEMNSIRFHTEKAKSWQLLGNSFTDNSLTTKRRRYYLADKFYSNQEREIYFTFLLLYFL